MDFTLSPEIEDIRVRTRAFVEEHVLPLESDPQNFSEHENIPLDRYTSALASGTGTWFGFAMWKCRSNATCIWLAGGRGPKNC